MGVQALAVAPPQPAVKATVAGFAPRSPLVLRRACACGGTPGPDGECAVCRAKRLARKQDTGTAVQAGVPPQVHEVLRSPGRPLDTATRALMESRFGHDFGHVRVHADAPAVASARMVNALAYTVGRHVVFGAGRYAPETGDGRRLLAHELAHVVQQGRTDDIVQPRLEVGSPHDPAEVEADRVAARVAAAVPGAAAAGPAATLTPSVPILRRQTTTPQRAVEGDTRLVTLPVERDAQGQTLRQVHVFRTLVPCPCRNVDETRTGVFYNPDLDNVAIAYRYCRGGTTTDVYGQLQSNATAFLQGQAPPVGTARVGIDVNVVGRRDAAGRIIVEALGTNEGGAGLGGRAQIVFERGQWRIFLEPQYLRRLQALPGAATQDELQVSLGARFGNVAVRFDLRDLLDPTARSGRGTVDIPLGPVSIQPFVEASEGRGVTFGVGVGGTIGGPGARREECRQCLCPAPARKYRCMDDVPPRDVPKRITEDVERLRELRYYFRLNRTDPSTDASLSARSAATLAEVASQVGAGGRVTLIFGYASPEATERHNADLSMMRAKVLRELVQSRLGASVELPPPVAGGELLGRRPTAVPSSRLGDAIARSGFRSAEDLSIFLFGDEIPNQELASQFLSLFAALPEPADRLALFGLAADDPLRTEVLAAVDRFIRSGGRGPRPWERVFQYLRYGLVRVTRTEPVGRNVTVRDPGSLKEMSDADCRPHARAAEAGGRFGPIAPEALRPTTSSRESNDDCLISPQRADLDRGCDYQLPPAFRQRATAPSVAPRRLP